MIAVAAAALVCLTVLSILTHYKASLAALRTHRILCEMIDDRAAVARLHTELEQVADLVVEQDLKLDTAIARLPVTRAKKVAADEPAPYVPVDVETPS